MKITNVSKSDLIASTYNRGFVILGAGKTGEVPGEIAERWIKVGKAQLVTEAPIKAPVASRKVTPLDLEDLPDAD